MELLGSGSFSICYLQDDGKVLKIYKEGKIKYLDQRMIGIKNDTYVFPDSLVIENGIPIGTVSRHIPSLALDKKDITLNQLINSIEKVYVDTDLLTNLGIESFDVYSRNMLYDGALKIIDTDFYSYSKKNKDDLRNDNIANINFGILQYLTNDNISFIEKDDLLYNEFNQVISDNNNRGLKSFLIHLKNQIEIVLGKPIELCSEIRQFLELNNNKIR